jgi:hypothetical protein
MAAEKTQDFSNHARLVPAYHGVLFALIFLGLIGSCVNLYLSIGDHHRIYSASLIVVLEVVAALLFVFCRTFALKAQDRAIRAEENLRHFVLTGRLLDPRLGVLQIVALRFASDAEFVELAARAAEQNMEPKAIKQAIKNWRADYYRV